MAEIEKIDKRISEILETLERGASIEEELDRVLQKKLQKPLLRRRRMK